MRRAILAGAVVVATIPTLLAAAKAPEKKKPRDPAADVNAKHPEARRIAFTTDQGTWTSLDVSPDGATIVFDLVGDLYTLPIAGGAARRLTSGAAWDCQPRWSPDGKSIAFTSDRSGIDNVWTIPATGGEPVAITAEKENYVRSPEWTPDGVWLLARREVGTRGGIPPVELYLYHRDGGSGIQLTNSDEGIHNAAGPVASRDGRFVYFSARRRPFDYIPNLQDGLWQILRLDRVSGAVTDMTVGVGGAARPAVSPDGGSLAFVSRRDGDTVLVLRDLPSGGERILARGLGRDEMEGFTQHDLYPGFDFTPDGSALVLADRGRIARFEVASGARSEIPFTAEVEQWAAPRVAWQERVADGPLAVRVLRRAGESPDGKSIVFEALGRIWRQRVEAGKTVGSPERITPDRADLPPREYAPAISPDGSAVAYVTWSDADLGQVWRVPLAGGEPVRLTRAAGHWANPAWSPDGKTLALVRGSGLEARGRLPEQETSFELHLLDAVTGGESRYVTGVQSAAGLIFHPQASFLEKGERLLFTRPVPGKKPYDEIETDLVSVRPDGSDERVHVRLPVAAEIAVSPDGTWVAFTSRDNAYLTALPQVRTKEPAKASLGEGALPVFRLSEPAGAFLGWADGGRTITWTLAETFHRMPVERALGFAAKQKREAAEKARKAAGDEEKKAEKKKEGEAAETEKPDLELPRPDAVNIVLTTPRPRPEGSVLFERARVVTMRGDEVLPEADLLVTGNRVAAIGAPGSLEVPGGATRLDARGKTIVPGLIDTHAHLHYSALENFPETKWEYLANLAYGVTTVYDPSAPTIDVFAQAEMVEAGRMVGPRVYSSGMVLYGGKQADWWAEVEDLEDARRQVRRMKAWGARMIKVYQQPRRAQRLWFAEAARQEKMLLTAEGAGETFTDLTMAIDGYTAFEHSLAVELGSDAVRFLAATGTHYTPTLLVSYGGPWGELYFWQTANPHADPKLNRFTPHFVLDNWGRRHPWVEPEEYQFQLVAEGAAAVLRAGGNVSLGAHGQVQGLGPHWELWAMAGENGRGKGMTAHEAWRAATERAAEKLGLLPDLGTVEKGKLADLLVLDADPLAEIENSTRIRWVVKNGEVWEAETMKKIWPTELEPPVQTWQR
jgi:Tol biopolymer transport system component/imidazolonepropionase-like amidohydrolase